VILRAAAVMVLLAGCTTRDTVATAGSGDPVDTYCQQSGPPVLIDDACTGDLAEAVFRNALCACGQLSLGAQVTTDAYDSRLGPYAPGGIGGHVGINEGFDANAAGNVTVGGDTTVAAGLQSGPRFDIAGNLAIGGALGRSSSTVTVGGAARVAGSIDIGTLTVTGALTTPAGATSSGNVMAGSRTTAPVSVPRPCRCEPSDVLDIKAIIAEHAIANHDADVGITPDELVDVEGDATLELPCGRFYLSRISATGGGTITLRATGRTAVFIGGDVTLDGSFTVEVAPGAEMDLFIQGFLSVPGMVRLGDQARPRALRVYIAAVGSIAISGGLALAGNLYAPDADLQTSAPVDVFGAVLLDTWQLSAPANIHYDKAIEYAGDTCVR
jgi:hypothetical protein